ncbi:carbonic anhydrase [Oligella urethralis]|uniref:carbonic anhydrase n=1 Tax=Oligella urethralis TaxID=90245 RepID=UPI0027B88854|nr:carbonic anhydrase [Oligella urethralis]
MFPQRLINGYNDFLNGRMEKERHLYKQLGEQGQVPEIMVISCGDSRVAPEIIFGAGPGELFVIRNIANLVPSVESGHSNADTQHGTSAAVEYATNALRVRHIVVLGHANCGGVRAYANKIAPLSKSDFIGKWMSQIKGVVDKIGPRPEAEEDEVSWIRQIELGVVEHSLNNLMTFPTVKERVESGDLFLHGAYFGIASGMLYYRNPKSGEFLPCLSFDEA